MDWYLYPVIAVAGFIAGIVNVFAGSGSLLTLPLLIVLGLPAHIANGTNRIAILLQNVVAVTSFRRQGILVVQDGLLLAVPAVLGAVIGAEVAVNLSEQLLRRVIGILMIAMLVVLLVRPASWLQGRKHGELNLHGWPLRVAYFAVGFYGGFIQAGVGIFLLAVLVLGTGYDLLRANAAKVFIILCVSIVALAVFILNDQVAWQVGLTLASGQMLGAWVAARTMVKRGTTFIRYFLIVVVLLAAAYMLGIIDY